MELRNSVDLAGTFITAPIPGVPSGLAPALKMEVRPEFSDEQPGGKTVLTANWLLFDPGALDPSALDLGAASKDCELLKEILESHPEEIKAIVAALQDDRGVEDILNAAKIAEQIGLTEEQFIGAGGGIFVTFGIIAVALLVGACSGSTATGSVAKRPPKNPTPPVPPDAGPGPGDGGNTPDPE